MKFVIYDRNRNSRNYYYIDDVGEWSTCEDIKGAAVFDEDSTSVMDLHVDLSVPAFDGYEYIQEEE